MIDYIMSLVIMLAYIYLMSKVINQKINYRNPKAIAAMVLAIIFLVDLDFLDGNSLLVSLIHLAVYAVVTKFIFENKWPKHLLVNFICFLLFGIIDSLIGLFMLKVLGFPFEELTSNKILGLITGVIAFFLIAIMTNIKFITNIIVNSIESLHIERSKLLLYLSAFILSLCAVIIYSTYYSVGHFITIVLMLIIVITFFGLFVMLIQEKNTLVKKEMENEMLVKNLKEYEELLEKNLISNHENKNSLLVIKGMLPKNNKKAKEYIDLLINERYADDEALLYKTSKFPIGGLQGLVYQKILSMKSKNIDFHLEMGKGISKESFKNITSSTNYDICTIVGILLDNSIEAVEKLEKRNISIYTYISGGNFNISISNNFAGDLDIEKIDEEGYSTKGKNRGFGLYIVKNVLNKNPNLNLTREINGDVFKQILTIKL